MTKREQRRLEKRQQIIEEKGIICLDNVTAQYPGTDTTALDQVSLRINKGEFVFIVGNSGSGKSTLIKLLLKEITPVEGDIYVGGYELNRLSHRKISFFRRTIGVVFQEFRLLKERTVYDNVAFAQRIIETPVYEIKRNVPEILAMVGRPGKYKASAKDLAGGEQQRVAIARALVNKPSILLADEPTGNLDPQNTREIMKLLEEINELGTTVVVVTHNNQIVDEMRKRVIQLNFGSISSDEEGGYYIYED